MTPRTERWFAVGMLSAISLSIGCHVVARAILGERTVYAETGPPSTTFLTASRVTLAVIVLSTIWSALVLPTVRLRGLISVAVATGSFVLLSSPILRATPGLSIDLIIAGGLELVALGFYLLPRVSRQTG